MHIKKKNIYANHSFMKYKNIKFEINNKNIFYLHTSIEHLLNFYLRGVHS